MSNNTNNKNQSSSVTSSNNNIKIQYKRQNTEYKTKNNKLPSVGNSIVKSVISFAQKKGNFMDSINSKKIGSSSNLIEEEIERISKELKLYRRKNKEIENSKLIYQTEDDLFLIDKILKEDNLLNIKAKDISFFDIICFILKKINKRVIENEILKIFFLKIEKLVAMFKPLNISLNDMFGKLVGHIKYEKKLKDNILFKEGDRGDKFYIILRGEVGILIQQESIINCTPLEYLKYLMVIYLYQERSMTYKMIFVNRENLRYDDRCFFTLMEVFKFYHFFKEFSTIKRHYRDVIEFVRLEKKICKYIHKKNDFVPEECFRILDLSNILAEELYNYYCRIIGDIQHVFLTEMGNPNKNINSAIKIINPTNLYEFGLYTNHHDHDESKCKSIEFFDKIYHINEVSYNSIYSSNVNDYINRLSCEDIIRSIKRDKNFFFKIYEEKKNFKYYQYIEVNQLKEGNIFGELALINPSKKRTASVIIREDCHLGVLNKEAYETSIKNAQEKERKRNLLFFTNGPIFNGIANNFFLNNYFFRFKKRIYNSGEVLFSRGEIRSKIIFVINGELQLSGKMTLKKLTDIIEYLSEGKDDGGLAREYCKESLEFKRIYDEDKKNFKFHTLKDKEIAGLDHMNENNIYLFDCICISLEPSEVYELDIKIFEELLRDVYVKKNNEDYVFQKKEILLNRLYKQRDSIAKNEFNRIKAFSLSIELSNQNDKKNNPTENVKTLNNYFPLTKTMFNTKIFPSFLDENQASKFINSSNINSYGNNSTNYFNKKYPILSTSRNLSAYSKANNRSIQIQNTNKLLKFDNTHQMKRENSLILLQINKEKDSSEDNNNLIKNNESDNIIRINKYINDSVRKNKNFSFPKKKLKLKMPAHHKNRILNKIVIPSSKELMREFTKKYIEPVKIPYHNKRFIFNNQKIFEPLLTGMINNKDRKEIKFINRTLGSEIDSIQKGQKDENNKENDNKGKTKIIFNREIENKSNKRDKSPIDKNKIFNKFFEKQMEENYKDIFLIDCLCLDKWEEKINKNRGKEKAKLKGKKLRT